MSELGTVLLLQCMVGSSSSILVFFLPSVLGLQGAGQGAAVVPVRYSWVLPYSQAATRFDANVREPMITSAAVAAPKGYLGFPSLLLQSLVLD